MRAPIAILTAALLAGAAPAAAPTSIDTSPLKPICDRLCGGTWRSAVPPAPDQFVVRYSYQWDSAMRAVRGTIVTTGGIAGVHEEATELFGYDAESKTIWVMRADGDGKPVYGAVTIAGDGFSETMQPVGDTTSTLTATYAFTDADTYTVTSEIAADGNHTLGAPETYRREK